MTIAIGMLCNNGIILGADREITLTSLTYEQKKAHVLKREDLQIGLVGAGSADLITFAAQALDRRIQDRQSADDVRVALEAVALEVHSHLQADPNFGALDLLVGVKTSSALDLLKVTSTVVIRINGYEAIGIGMEMARFVLRGLYESAASVTSERGILLVIHGLKAAKENVPGCGGPSDVLLLRRRYHIYEVPEDVAAEQEQDLTRFAAMMNPVMLALSDIEVQPQQLSRVLDEVEVNLNNFRTASFLQRQRERFQQHLRILTPGRVTFRGHAPSVVIRSATLPSEPQPSPDDESDGEGRDDSKFKR